MLYIQQSLSAGEKIIHIGRFHWFYNLNAALNILLGLIIAIIILAVGIYLPLYVNLPFIQYYPSPDAGLLTKIRQTDPTIRIGAFLSILFGIGKFAQMMIVRATTEICVTTTRVVYKRGVVARYVGEMAIDSIEGVNVLQTLMGRLMGYGRVMVRGMGVGEVLFPTIVDPVLFRKAIYKAQSVSRRRRAREESILDQEERERAERAERAERIERERRGMS